MCGINGILGHRGLRPRDTIVRMNEALQHRGPDADGVFLDEEIVLGHRRLAIIDTGGASDQPFTDPSGRYTLVFNGELYNYRSLRDRLKDWDFRTDGDTEVLLAAYLTWGTACLQWFNGMFAFAIWDADEQVLLLARDRIGIKPLYYTEIEETFLFSSEIGGLLASGKLSPRLDKSRLREYLRYQTVMDPNTILEGVHTIPAGHFLTLSTEGMQLSQYWEMDHFSPEPLRTSVPEAEQQVFHLLEKAVQRRMVSDVPIGAFLSGGIDSSAIVSLMSDQSNTQVSTFHISFDEGEFSEAPYARMVAEKFKTAHHDIRLKPEALLDALPSTLAAMDHPSGDGPNSYVVSKAAKDAGITVALSGLGGDELFAGYPHFAHQQEVLHRRWLVQFPKFLRSLAAQLKTRGANSVSAWKTREVLSSYRFEVPFIYPIFRYVMLPHWADKVLSPEVLKSEDPIHSGLMRRRDERNGMPIISQISMAEMSYYLRHTLLRDTDMMSMAHALEVRVPFMDHELVEYVLRLPDEIKQGQSPKALLVSALGDRLPRDIVDRPKMGFTLPWADWMKKELKEFCQAHLRSLGQRRFMSQEGVEEAWQGFLHDDPQLSWARIWHLITLEYWLARHGIED